MAQGTRNGGTDRARRALESCIARLRRGETIAQALADFPHETDDLRSLLSTFEHVQAAAVAPPAAPRGLLAGRERFLAAADSMRTAASALPADDWFADEADALDRALSGAAAVTANGHASAHGLGELVDLAAAMRRDVRPVPALNGALAMGRRRFLGTAEALRLAQAAGEGAALPLADAIDAESLDVALARVASGASVHAAAAGAPESARLAELLEIARDLGTAAVPGSLPHRGRAGFLAAAEGLAIATGRQPADAAVDAELLDAAVARLMAGEPTATLVGEVSGATAGALVGLLRTAEAIADAAPAPAADLAPGRARLLEVAGGVRALRSAGRALPGHGRAPASGPFGRLGGLVRPFRPSIAAMAAAITLAVFAGNAVLVPVSAGARPGDGLLYRHKLLMQDLRLAVAVVNPSWRADVRAEISRERFVDIAAAGAEDVEVSVDGRLRGYEDLTQPGEKAHGLIHVSAFGDDGNDRHLTAAWRFGQTRVTLPEGYATLGDVPAGTSMRLKIRTGEEPPLALKVALLGLDPLVPLTATLTVTATASNTPTGSAQTPTATPTDLAASATPTTTPTTTATLQPTATFTPTLASPTPTIANPVVVRNMPRGQELEGQVVRIGTSDWTVRRAANARKGDPDDVAIDVEVSMAGLSNAVIASSVQVGDRVRLRGEYVNGRRDRFAAVKLLSHMSRDVACKDRGTVLGVVLRYQPGAGLVLLDGTAFEFDATAQPAITGAIQVGSTVIVAHQDCGGRLVARAVTVTDGGTQAPPVSQEFNGVVRAVDGARTMSLELGGALYTVRFDPATVMYQGQPVVIEPGQRVSVWGRLIDESAAIVEAERVEVLRLAPLPTPSTPDPTATPDPLPSSTPDPMATSTPGLDGRPEPLPPLPPEQVGDE